MKVEGWGVLDRDYLDGDTDYFPFLTIFKTKKGLIGQDEELVRVTLEIPDRPQVTGRVEVEESTPKGAKE